MCRVRSSASAIAMVAALALSCGDDPYKGPMCLQPAYWNVLPTGCATYTHVVTGDSGSWPYGAEERQITVDRAAGLVHVRYTKDGKQVVETWKIVTSTFRDAGQ